jgi:hypothetical protein
MDDTERREWLVKIINTSNDFWGVIENFSEAARVAVALERSESVIHQNWCIENLRTGDILPAAIL